MTGIVTTALVGFFVWAPPAASVVNQGLVPAEEAPAPSYVSHAVAMTGYNAVPEQTDADPFTTASGAYSNPDVVVARSVDLAEKLPFGTVIEVVPGSAAASGSCGLDAVHERIGLRVVADSMHPRKRNQIDILFHMPASGKNPALTLGMCKDVEIRVVGKVDIAKIPRSQEEIRLALGQSSLAARK